MHASSPSAPPRLLPAYLLALAVLGMLAAGGIWMGRYIRLAPGTPIPIQAQAGGLNKSYGAGKHQVPQEAEPHWSQLSTAQKEALYPLANSWRLMSETQKRNWLHLALDFHALSPEEQAKMLARMTDWANLSIQQRSQARMNYAATAALPAESKRAKWAAYQALSAEEKKRLADRATLRTKGAATAIRPSPKKLVRIPAASNAPAAEPNPPKITLILPAASRPQAPAPLPPVVVETAPVQPHSADPTPLPPLPPLSSPAQPQTVPAPEAPTPLPGADVLHQPQ